MTKKLRGGVLSWSRGSDSRTEVTLFSKVRRLSTALTKSMSFECKVDPKDQNSSEVINDDNAEPEGSIFMRFHRPINMPDLTNPSKFHFNMLNLRMLDLYHLIDRHLDFQKWCPLYTDTKSLYMAWQDKITGSWFNGGILIRCLC